MFPDRKVASVLILIFISSGPMISYILFRPNDFPVLVQMLVSSGPHPSGSAERMQ